jgi:hypothetical protein
MRFFSKFTFICNLCFLVAAVMHYCKLYINESKFPQPLNFIKGTVVILAEFGWILNFVFVLLVVIILAAKKKLSVPKWLLIFNAVMLLLQIYYYFLDKS